MCNSEGLFLGFSSCIQAIKFGKMHLISTLCVKLTVECKALEIHNHGTLLFYFQLHDV